MIAARTCGTARGLRSGYKRRRIGQYILHQEVIIDRLGHAPLTMGSLMRSGSHPKGGAERDAGCLAQASRREHEPDADESRCAGKARWQGSPEPLGRNEAVRRHGRDPRRLFRHPRGRGSRSAGRERCGQEHLRQGSGGRLRPRRGGRGDARAAQGLGLAARRAEGRHRGHAPASGAVSRPERRREHLLRPLPDHRGRHDRHRGHVGTGPRNCWRRSASTSRRRSPCARSAFPNSSWSRWRARCRRTPRS